MKVFLYNSELYIRCIPSKTLFRSTMIHEVVNRGDIFAIHVGTQELRIIPGRSEVQHLDGSLQLADRAPVDKAPDSGYTVPSKSQAERLEQLKLALGSPEFEIRELVRANWWTERSKASIKARRQDEHGEWQYQLTGFTTWYAEHELVRINNGH